MPKTSPNLFWNEEIVAKRLRSKGIHSREDLAKLPGMARTSVYRAFAPDWSGKATPPMITALSRALNAPLNQLVKDPRK